MTRDNKDEPIEPIGANVIQLSKYRRTEQPLDRNGLMHQFLGEIQDLAYQLDALLYLAEQSDSRKAN